MVSRLMSCLKTQYSLMPESSEKREPVGLEYLRNNLQEILWLEQSPKAGKIITEVSRFVLHQCGELRTHQIRNIFGRIKRADTPGKLQIARNFLTYTAGRQDEKSQAAIKLFNEILEKVRTPAADAKAEDHKNAQMEVRNVQHFFESIVAFHKFHFGDKNK